MAGRVAAYAISASNCTQRGGVPGVRIVKSWPAGGCCSSVIRVPAIVRSGLRRRTLLRDAFAGWKAFGPMRRHLKPVAAAAMLSQLNRSTRRHRSRSNQRLPLTPPLSRAVFSPRRASAITRGGRSGGQEAHR